MNTIPDNMLLGCTSLKSITILGNINTIGASAFLNCPELNAVYYYGTKSPTTINSDSFDDPFNGHIYITNSYTEETFGTFPVSLIPTQVFSATNDFSSTNYFTESNDFSSSSHFTKSDFIKSNAFTNSDFFLKVKH